MRIFLHIYFGFSQIMCESQEEQFSHVWEVGIDKGVQFGVALENNPDLDITSLWDFML